MRTISRALVLALFAVTLISQAKTPDFSGQWVMVSPAAGTQMQVKHDETTLTTAPMAQPGPTVVYTLDGTASRHVVKSGAGEVVTVSRVAWKDSQLVVTSTITFPEGQTLEQVILWSLDGKGQLVLEVQNTGTAPAKMVYKKQ